MSLPILRHIVGVLCFKVIFPTSLSSHLHHDYTLYLYEVLYVLGLLTVISNALEEFCFFFRTRSYFSQSKPPPCLEIIVCSNYIYVFRFMRKGGQGEVRKRYIP